MKNLHFKVYADFSRYVPIDETELEKALYAFQTGKPVIFENGAINKVESVIPDLNKSLGWYSEYKPNQDDNAELDRARVRHAGYIGQIKEKVQYLISQGKTDLIGKNIDMPELKKIENPASKEISALAEKMKV